MINDAFEITEYKGHTIELHYDTDPMHPRTEFDNLGTMYCRYDRYTLGDPDAPLPGSDDIVLPLYVYEHGGMTMNTTGFSCPWDSGQVGYIYISRDDVRQEYDVDHITDEVLNKVKKMLVSEVEAYDKYLRGEAYGFVVRDEDGEEIDSCWGFDDSDYCKEQAVDLIDYMMQINAPCEQLTLDIHTVTL